MAIIQRLEDLDIRKLARKITNRVYDVSDLGPFSKDFGLRDQMRRASVSIMSNIAEGFESASDNMFIRYLGYAKASAGELRAQTYIASDRKYISKEEFDLIIEETRSCSRQIAGFMKYLSNNPKSRRIKEGSLIYEIPDDIESSILDD